MHYTKPICYTLENKSGNLVKITNFGAKVMSIIVPDKDGKKGNIVLGYDNPEEYLSGDAFFGATVGRYANRIAKASFKIDDKTYFLQKNDGENNLHSGENGFHNVFWQVKQDIQDKKNKLLLSYISEDMEGGFPGKLKVEVHYQWTDNNELIIDYKATTDKTTVINMTHHSYFNLKDGGKSNILQHIAQINSDSITAVNKNLIPTGEFMDVSETPFDFRTPKSIGRDINMDHEQLKLGRGYDHNFILNNDGNLQKAAEIFEPETGRIMEVITDQAGMQFYTGNWIDGSEIGHDQTKYTYRSAFCCETQHYPDAPNQPHFPSTLLNPGEVYKHKTIYKFSIKK